MSRRSSCRNFTGTPKQPFAGKAQAEGAMRAMLKATGAAPEQYGAYECPDCHSWHYGRGGYKNAGKRRKRDVGRW